MNDVIGDATIKMQVEYVFGARKFKVTNGNLPVAGSSEFLRDSQNAILDASAHK